MTGAELDRKLLAKDALFASRRGSHEGKIMTDNNASWWDKSTGQWP